MKYIINTYKPFYYDLIKGYKLKCYIQKNWEYEINLECKIKDKTFFYIVYNLNNGYCEPNKKIEEIKKELIDYIKTIEPKYKQLTIFDFI